MNCDPTVNQVGHAFLMLGLVACTIFVSMVLAGLMLQIFRRWERK